VDVENNVSKPSDVVKIPLSQL